MPEKNEKQLESMESVRCVKKIWKSSGSEFVLVGGMRSASALVELPLRYDFMSVEKLIGAS